MAEGELKSHQFRREREAAWRELDGLLRKMERGSARSLAPQELMRLPSLYRAALSSLSVARSISLDQGLLGYLESLAARAYLQIYAPRAGLAAVIAGFFGRRFPVGVRALRRHILLALLLMGLGAVAGYRLTMSDPQWYTAFIPAGMAQGRLPTTPTEELRRGLYEPPTIEEKGILPFFASYLFVHNAGIAIMSFALGFAFGLPTIGMMIYNGLTLGAFVALYAGRGLGFGIGGWLIIHGSTELLAVGLCGGAGLAVADAMLFPEQRSRMAAIAARGRLAGMVALGAVGMLLVAGLLEGIGRSVITEDTTRYLIGIGMLAVWLLVFLRPPGRTSEDDEP